MYNEELSAAEIYELARAFYGTVFAALMGILGEFGMGTRLIILVTLSLVHCSSMAADDAPKYTATEIDAIWKARCVDLSGDALKTCRDQVWREYSPAGSAQPLGPCEEAKKKFAEANQKFKLACPSSKRESCEAQAEACQSECKTVNGKADKLCSKETDRDILKEVKAQREASYQARKSGISLAKPKPTDKLYYCPPFAGAELVKYNKSVKEQKDEVQTIEDEINDLKEKLSTGEDSIEGKLADLQITFKEELEKTKTEYDDEVEKIDTTAKEKEKDLSGQFQKNVDQIENLKLKLKDLENQRVVALRKEGELTCLKKGQDCVDAKLAERALLLKSNKLKSQGGLMGTLNNTGKKMIEKNCQNLYNQCLKNPATTAILEAINRQFDLQVEATHKEIQSMIQQNASVITQLKEIDPEKMKARQKATEKFQKKTESLQSSFNAKNQQLLKAKAALEQQIKSKELKLVEAKAQFTVDLAYSKAAERAIGAQADDDAAKKFQDYMAAYSELQGAAFAVDSITGCSDPLVKQFKNEGGETGSGRGTNQ